MNDAIAPPRPRRRAAVRRATASGSANRRLAIIDLSPAGHQPMANEDGSVWLVYNGELYNFRELRRELEARGHRFRSTTDTEVVVHAYEEWGAGLRRALRRDVRVRDLGRSASGSSFSRATASGSSRSTTTQVDGRLLFGSEVKVAARRPASRARVVAARRSSSTSPSRTCSATCTLFDGVRMLPAGHTLTVSEAGARASGATGTSSFDPDDGVSAEEWAERIRGVFERVVTRQLISDVPVGSYLSGGMDSASIAAVASRSVPRLMTFTGGFDLSSVDRPRARLRRARGRRARREPLPHRALRDGHARGRHGLGAARADLAPRGPARRHVLPELLHRRGSPRSSSRWRSAVRAATSSSPATRGATSSSRGLDDAQRVRTPRTTTTGRGSFPTARSSSFFTPDVLARAGDHSPFDALPPTCAPAAGLDPLSKALYFEAQDLPARPARGRGQGLDGAQPRGARAVPRQRARRRSPGRSRPGSSTVSGGGKKLLRDAMAPLLPEDIVAEAQAGLQPARPVLVPRADDGLHPRDAARPPQPRRAAASSRSTSKRVLHEHLEGRVNHRLLIWSLLSFEWWNRLFIDGDAATALAERTRAARAT